MEGYAEHEIPKSPVPQFDPGLEQANNVNISSESFKAAINLERFAELPSRREALRAKDADNLTVFLSHSIAKKLYRCPCCAGNIPIGSEHVVMSRVQMSRAYNHHHLDFICTQKKILPTLKAIQIINPQDASATAMNKRGRKFRNRQRRSS